jgi:methyl-accepting chemotaxis protein
MHFGVRKQIWSLPAIAVLIFGIGIAVSVAYSSRALALIDRVSVADYPLLEKVKALAATVQRVTDDYNAAVAEGERTKLDEARADGARVKDLLLQIGQIPGEAEFARRVGDEFEAYRAPADSVARIMLGVETGDAKPGVAVMQGAIRLLNDDLDKATQRASAQFAANLAATEENIRNLLRAIIGAAVAVVLLLMLVSHIIVKAIWRQLGGEPEYATRIARAIARGDLATPIELDRGDTTSQLAALKQMQGSLASLIENIRVAAGSVRGVAHEISAGMTDLSARTDQQASSLEETAANMEELTTTVKQNAAHAVRAKSLAQASTAVATQGGAVVRSVATTMDEIDRRSGNIANIVSVIDSIAFQTNILALNAAVEAARAGEQGRGFAVVAAEVRSLAQKSAASAKEIKDLIGASTQAVATGRRLASEAGTSVEQIVQSISEVSGVVGEISSASAEQSAGITQMGLAVTQIENVTQQNAALVEQASAAAQSMSDQARDLEEAVSVFKLAQTDAPDRGKLADAQPPARGRLAGDSYPGLPPPRR